MPFTIADVVARLEYAGVRMDRGLTDADVKRVEKKFGFGFGPEHRELLRTVLPLGDAWLNWRHATPSRIRERLQAPVEGIVLDVLTTGFWVAAWGIRPDDDREAEGVAREQLSAVPVLVPLYGHRYLPAAPAARGCPVFSVIRSEVAVHGADLLRYIDVEFGDGAPPSIESPDSLRLDFWSDLASGPA